MSNHHLIIVIFSLLVVINTAYAAGRHGALVGGYSPIKNLNDPYVQEIAKYAVDEHNNKGSSSDHLKLVKVVKGESQVVAGTNYRLTLATNDGHQYVAVVYDKPWQHYRSLTSFTAVAV